MAPADKGKQKLLPEQLQGPSPQRPQSLLQRLSSGLNSMVPSLPLRRASRSNLLFDRPTIEPAPSRILSRNNLRDCLRSPVNQQQPIPHIHIPLLSEPDQPCPYDASKYHSFPSIEPRRCSFCGLRSSSRPARDLEAANSPCVNCRTRSPLSHIASAFRRSRPQNRSKSVAQNNAVQRREVSSSPDEPPRIVPAAIAAKRLGNPPRRASLPAGMVTNYGTLRPPVNPHAPPTERPAVRQRGIPPSSNVAGRPSKDSREPDVRPISPKLHHIHGLPGAKKTPYVHKREVEAHLTALRAGSPSPLRRSIDEGTIPRARLGSAIDYSETVFYGTSWDSNTNRRPSSTQPTPSTNPRTRLTITRRVDSITIERGERGGQPTNLHEELANSAVYRRRTPQPPNQQRPRNPEPPIKDSESEDFFSFSTLTTQTPSTIGGKRLELRGGNSLPKLRGGSGGHRAVEAGRGYKFKKWLLTCQGPCRIGHGYDTDSDDDLPPARVPSPERVAWAIRRSQGRAPLPANISKGCARTVGNEHLSTELVGGTAFTSVVDTTPPTGNEAATQSHIPGIPVDSAPTQAHSSRSSLFFFDAPEVQNPQVLKLRGGAGSSSAWKDTDRLPSTLYWLAGGKGKPITVGSWKKQKPKKRMGGLLGMALYGREAGTEYERAHKSGGPGSVTAVEVGVGVSAGLSASKLSGGKSATSGSSRSSSAGAVRAVPTPVQEEVTPPAAEPVPAAAPDAGGAAIPPPPVAATNAQHQASVEEQTG